MNDALKKAKIFVGMVKKTGFPVQSAFLFGSYAKGTAGDDSDIDVCVISSKFGKDYIEEMVKLRRIAMDVDINLEPIPMTPKDLADPYSSLSLEIRTTGLPIPI